MSVTTLSPPVTLATSRRRRGIREARSAFMLLAPSLVFLVLFTYWPVLATLREALTIRSLVAAPTFGLGNFARLAADPHFTAAAVNTALYAVGTIVPSLALALAFAVALVAPNRLNHALRALVALPVLIPLVAAAALFTFILLPGQGLIDWYLGRLGIASVNWLGTPTLALGSIAAITVWKNTGYYMLFFLAGLAGIPAELHEAAMLDGAGAASRFRRITLPLLGPTFAFVGVIAMLNAITQIDHVVTMTAGGPSDSTNMLLYYIYQQAEQNSDPGLASAATAVSVAVLLSLALISLRRLERGIHYES